MRTDAQRIVALMREAKDRYEWRAAFRAWNDCPKSTPEETAAILAASREAKARINAAAFRDTGQPEDFSFTDGT
jgi:hypothetical protein